MAMFLHIVAACVMLASFPAAGDRAAEPPAASRPSTDVAQLPDRLKVVTFNLQQCLGGTERIIEFLRAQNADLIFLQEVPATESNQHDTTARIAEALGGLRVVSAATLDIPAKEHCDQAILSRFPLSDGRARTVVQGEWVYAVEATIQGRDGPLHLFSVHTHSTAELTTENMIRTSAARLAEVSALLDVVGKLAGDLIVAGDFNAAPWMPEYSGITRVLSDFGAVDQDAKLSFPSYKPSVRIDYIFGRGGWSARSYQVLDVRLSDHRAVLAELELKAPTSQPQSRAISK